MSNFKDTVVNKETGEEVLASFYDDYYGRHKYGILVKEQVLTEDEFSQKWKRKG